VPGAQGVGGDPGGVKSGGLGAAAEHAGDGAAGPGWWLMVLAHRRVNSAPGVSPRRWRQAFEGGDGVGGGVPAVRDRDERAVAFLVHLRGPDGEQEAGGLVLDVGQGEGDQFGAAQGGGVAEQDHRRVPDADDGGAVDGVDDLAELVDGERAGEAAGCGP
jgi:hypothetical protein